MTGDKRKLIKQNKMCTGMTMAMNGMIKGKRHFSDRLAHLSGTVSSTRTQQRLLIRSFIIASQRNTITMGIASTPEADIYKRCCLQNVHTY